MEPSFEEIQTNLIREIKKFEKQLDESGRKWWQYMPMLMETFDFLRDKVAAQDAEIIRLKRLLREQGSSENQIQGLALHS